MTPVQAVAVCGVGIAYAGLLFWLIGVVHAFVEQATGNVIKPAGWKAPAKSIARGHEGELLSKYNLATGLTALLDRLHSDSGCIYGGYLYQ